MRNNTEETLRRVIENHWPGARTGRRLGTGASGSVFEVIRSIPEAGIEDREAVKIIAIPLHEESLDPLMLSAPGAYCDAAMRAAASEIAVLQQLKSAHIIHINDYAAIRQDGDYGWYILIRMDLLQPLQRLLPRFTDCPADRAEEAAARIALHIGDALRVCHSASLIHRDIKPQNILYRETADEYILADFGIARQYTDSLRQTLTVAGSGEYMAPEMLTGQYDFRSDLYSLGLVLYQVVNHGRPLFGVRYPNIQDAGELERIRAKRLGCALPTAPDNCSPRFARIILKLCAPYPDNRYSSIDEVLRDVRRPDAAAFRVPEVQGTGKNPPEAGLPCCPGLSCDFCPDRLVASSFYQKYILAPLLELDPGHAGKTSGLSPEQFLTMHFFRRRPLPSPLPGGQEESMDFFFRNFIRDGNGRRQLHRETASLLRCLYGPDGKHRLEPAYGAFAEYAGAEAGLLRQLSENAADIHREAYAEAARCLALLPRYDIRFFNVALTWLFIVYCFNTGLGGDRALSAFIAEDLKFTRSTLPCNVYDAAAMTSPLPKAAVCGRQQDLNRLKNALRNACIRDGRHPGAVWLYGERGIGKTTLVRHLLREISVDGGFACPGGGFVRLDGAIYAKYEESLVSTIRGCVIRGGAIPQEHEIIDMFSRRDDPTLIVVDGCNADPAALEQDITGSGFFEEISRSCVFLFCSWNIPELPDAQLYFTKLPLGSLGTKTLIEIYRNNSGRKHETVSDELIGTLIEKYLLSNTYLTIVASMNSAGTAALIEAFRAFTVGKRITDRIHFRNDRIDADATLLSLYGKLFDDFAGVTGDPEKTGLLIALTMVNPDSETYDLAEDLLSLSAGERDAREALVRLGIILREDSHCYLHPLTREYVYSRLMLNGSPEEVIAVIERVVWRYIESGAVFTDYSHKLPAWLASARAFYYLLEKLCTDTLDCRGSWDSQALRSRIRAAKAYLANIISYNCDNLHDVKGVLLYAGKGAEQFALFGVADPARFALLVKILNGVGYGLIRTAAGNQGDNPAQALELARKYLEIAQAMVAFADLPELVDKIQGNLAAYYVRCAQIESAPERRISLCEKAVRIREENLQQRRNRPYTPVKRSSLLAHAMRGIGSAEYELARLEDFRGDHLARNCIMHAASLVCFHDSLRLLQSGMEETGDTALSIIAENVHFSNGYLLSGLLAGFERKGAAFSAELVRVLDDEPSLERSEKDEVERMLRECTDFDREAAFLFWFGTLCDALQYWRRVEGLTNLLSLVLDSLDRLIRLWREKSQDEGFPADACSADPLDPVRREVLQLDLGRSVNEQLQRKYTRVADALLA